MAAGDPPYTAADLQPGLERDLLAVFFKAAVDQEPTLAPSEGGMAAGRVAALVMLNRLARSKTFARVAQRAFIGNLKQVSAFLTDPAMKQNVLISAGAGPDQRRHQGGDRPFPRFGDRL